MPAKDPVKRTEYKRKYAVKNAASIRERSRQKRIALLADGRLTNNQREKIKLLHAEAIKNGLPMPTEVAAFIARMLFNQAKWRAKEYGFPFDLELSDVIVPDVCPISGNQLVINSGRGPSANSPTLDRIVPALGYVRGNVNVISCAANTTKGDKDVNFIQRLLAYMEGKL